MLKRCRLCKKKKEKVMKSGRTTTGVQLWACRPCNRARAREYYHRRGGKPKIKAANLRYLAKRFKFHLQGATVAVCGQVGVAPSKVLSRGEFLKIGILGACRKCLKKLK